MTRAIEYIQKKIRGLKAIFSGLFSGDQKDKNQAVEKIKDILRKISKNILGAAAKAGKQVTSVFKSLWQKISSFFSFQQFYEKAKSKLLSVVQSVSKAFEPIGKKAGQIRTRIEKNIWPVFQSLGKKISSFFTFQWLPESARNKILSVFQSASKAVDPFIKKLEHIWSWIQQKYSGLKDIFGGLFSGKSEDVEQAFNKIKEKISGTLDKISAYVQKKARGMKAVLKGLFSDKQEDKEWALNKIAEKVKTVFDGIKNAFKGSPIETFLISVANALNRIWNSAPMKGLRKILFGDSEDFTATQIQYGGARTKNGSVYDQQIADDELRTRLANRNAGTIDEVTGSIKDQNGILGEQNGLLASTSGILQVILGTANAVAFVLWKPWRIVLAICAGVSVISSLISLIRDKISRIDYGIVFSGVKSSTKSISSGVDSVSETIGPISRLEELFIRVKERITKIAQTIKEILDKTDFSKIAKIILKIGLVILLLSKLPKSVNLGKFGTFGLTTALDDLADDMQKIAISFGVIAGSFIAIALLVKVLKQDEGVISGAIGIMLALAIGLSAMFLSLNNLDLSPTLNLTFPVIIGAIAALVFIAELLLVLLKFGNFSWHEIGQTIALICSIIISIGITGRLMTRVLKQGETSVSAAGSFIGIGIMLFGLANLISMVLNTITAFKKYFDKVQSIKDFGITILAVCATLGSIIVSLVVVIKAVESVNKLSKDTNAKSIAAFSLILLVLPKFIESIVRILNSLTSLTSAAVKGGLKDLGGLALAVSIIVVAVVSINFATFAMKSLNESTNAKSIAAFSLILLVLPKFIESIVRILNSLTSLTSAAVKGGLKDVDGLALAVSIIVGAVALIKFAASAMQSLDNVHFMSIAGYVVALAGLSLFLTKIMQMLNVMRSMGDSTAVTAYFGAIALLIGALSLLMKSIASIKIESVGSLLKSLFGLIGVTAVLSLFASALLSLIYIFEAKSIDISYIGKILVTLTGAAVIISAMAFALVAIQKLSKPLAISDVKNASKFLAIAAGVLAVIAAFILAVSFLIPKVNFDSSAFSGFIDACWKVAGLLGAITVAAGIIAFATKLLSITNYVKLIGILAIAAGVLAVIAAFILAVSFLIPKVNFDSSAFSGFIDACWKVAGLLGAMAVVMGVIGAFNVGAILAVIIGGVVLGATLAIISGLIWLVVKISEKARELDNELADSGGILEAINYVSGFMSAFMSLLGDLVGSFVGSVVGSFADTFTSYLPSIATSLSDFLTNLQPLLESLDDLGEDHLKGAGTLVLILGAIFCAEFFTILTTAISKFANQEKMSEVLRSIKTMVTDDLVPFLDAIADFGEDELTAIGNFNKIMGKLVGLSFFNSVANFISKFGGDNQLGTALSNLSAIVADDGDLSKFLAAIKDYGTEEQLNVISNFNEIMKKLASITAYDKLNSFIGSFGSKVDFGNFNENMKSLGEGVSDFYETVSDVNIPTVTSSLGAIGTMLSLLKSDVLKSGSFIVGAVSPASIGTAFTTLLGDGGSNAGIVGYLNKFVEQTRGHDYANAVSAAGVISTLLNVLSTKWDNLDQFVKSKNKKAKNLESTIEWISKILLPKLFTLQTESTDLDTQRIIDIFSAVETVLNAMSFGDYGRVGFSMWDENVQEDVIGALTFFADKLIPELMALDISLGGQDFSAVKALGETISAILAPLSIEQNMSPEDIQKRLISMREVIVSEMEQLNEALAETNSDGNSLANIFGSISNFSVDLNSFAQIGQYVVEGLTNAFYNGDNQSAVYTAAFSLGLQIKSGLMAATDEHSPSKVAETIGLFVAEGLVNGLKGGSLEVQQAAAMLGLDLNRSLNKAVTEHEVNMAAYNLQDENHFNMPDFTYTNRFGEEWIDFDAMRSWLHEKFDSSLGPEIIDSYVGAWHGALAESEHVIQDSDYAAVMGKIARGDFGLGEDSIIAGLTEFYSAEADAVGLATQAYEDYNSVLDGTVKINQDLLRQQKENPPMTPEQYQEMLKKDQEAWEKLNSGELHKLAAQNGTTWQAEAAKLGYNPDNLNRLAIGNYLYSRSDYEDLVLAILAEKELAKTTKELKPLDEFKVIPEGTAEETEKEAGAIKNSLNGLRGETERIRPEPKDDKIIGKLPKKDSSGYKRIRGTVDPDADKSIENANELDVIYSSLMTGAELTDEQIAYFNEDLYDLFNGGKLGNGIEQRAQQLEELTGVSKEAALYYSKAFASNPADKNAFSSYVPIYKAYLGQTEAAAAQTAQSNNDIAQAFSKWITESVQEQGVEALSDGAIELDVSSLADKIGIDTEKMNGLLGDKLTPDGKFVLNIDDFIDGASSIDQVFSMLTSTETVLGVISKMIGDETGSLGIYDILDLFDLFRGETKGLGGIFSSVWNTVTGVAKDLGNIGKDETDINVDSSQVNAAEVSLAAMRKQYELTKDSVSGEPLLVQQAYKKRQNGELLTSAEAAELQKLYNGYMVGTYTAEDLEKWGFNWADELRYWGNDYSQYIDDTVAYVDEISAKIDDGNYTIKNLMEDANAGKFGQTSEIRKRNFAALGMDADKVESLFQKYLVNSEEALYNIEDNYGQLSDAEKEAIEQAQHYEEVLNTTPQGAFRAISDFLSGVDKVIQNPETLTKFNSFMNDAAANLAAISIPKASEFEKVADFLTILRTVANGSGGISNDFLTFIQTIEGALNGIQIKEEALTPITEFFNALNVGLSATDGSGISTFLRDFYNAISGDASDAGAAANTIVNAIIDAFNGRKSDFIGVGSAIVQWIADSIRANTAQAIDASHTLISNIISAFNEGLSSPEAATKLSESLKELFDSVMGEGEKTAQQGQKQRGSFAETMKKFGNNVVMSMAQAFSDPENVELIQNGLGQLFGLTETEEGEGFNGGSSNISEIFGTLSDGIGLITSAIDPGGAAAAGIALVNGLAEGVNESMGVCYAAGNALRGAFQMPGYGEGFYLGMQYAIGYAAGVAAGTSGAAAAGGGLGNSAVEGTKEAGEVNSPSKVMRRLGEYFNIGFVKGIDSGTGDAYRAGEGIANASLSGVADTAGIHSPAKETYKYGVYFDKGLANGIRAGIDEVTSAATTLTTATMRTFGGLIAIEDPFANIFGEDGVDSFEELYATSEKLQQSMAKVDQNYLRAFSLNTVTSALSKLREGIALTSDETIELNGLLYNIKMGIFGSGSERTDIYKSLGFDNDQMRNLLAYGIEGSIAKGVQSAKVSVEELAKYTGKTLDLSQVTQAEVDIARAIIDGVYGVGKAREDYFGGAYDYYQSLAEAVNRGETINIIDEKGMEDAVIKIGNTIDHIGESQPTVSVVVDANAAAAYAELDKFNGYAGRRLSQTFLFAGDAAKLAGMSLNNKDSGTGTVNNNYTTNVSQTYNTPKAPSKIQNYRNLKTVVARYANGGGGRIVVD